MFRLECGSPNEFNEVKDSEDCCPSAKDPKTKNSHAMLIDKVALTKNSTNTNDKAG